jgi:alpha-beta hydrolase superfamily lysophospholipase
LFTASKLTQRGFALFALDHQGHGKSTGTRAYFQSINDVVDDLHQFALEVDAVFHSRFPGAHATTPRVLFGHSMGGLIATLSALELNTDAPLPRVAAASELPVIERADGSNGNGHVSWRWDALIASAPALLLDAELAPPPLKAAARVLGELQPKLVLDGVPLKHLSRSDLAIATYAADPLVWLSGVRARVGREFIRGGDHCVANAAKLKLPLLILHGADDKVG